MFIIWVILRTHFGECLGDRVAAVTKELDGPEKQEGNVSLPQQLAALCSSLVSVSRHRLGDFPSSHDPSYLVIKRSTIIFCF